jgi:hypothetical protein
MHVFSDGRASTLSSAPVAGALIGLQFVVITLVADSPNSRDMERASSAFATPTIVHFGAVLLLSAILSAPCTEPVRQRFSGVCWVCLV